MTEMLNQDSRAEDDQGLTREAWLHRAIEAFRPRFAEIGLPLPDKIHVSVGFGYSSRAESKHILGQCWARRASADGVNHIFLGPQEGDPAGMLVSLLHELIHAADDCASGHKGAFTQAATRLGFEGPMTQTPPGIELAAEVITLAEALGPFPHARLDPAAADAPTPVPPGAPAPDSGGKVHSGPGKQGTRLIKLTTPCCGYTVRTTRKWLDQGYPLCPTANPCARNDHAPHDPNRFKRLQSDRKNRGFGRQAADPGGVRAVRACAGGGLSVRRRLRRG
jgi:hypothetical protein